MRQKFLPNGSGAVMAQRIEPPDSLDYFPTPPWATRALFKHVFGFGPLGGPGATTQVGLGPTVWEPACGWGHMSGVLEEYFETVIASDVFDYSGGDPGRRAEGWLDTIDFLDAESSLRLPPVDWIITNPPFKTALDFAERSLAIAKRGFALFVRTQWIEGGERYERLFRDNPPRYFSPFCERVPLIKGRWDPGAASATSYAWFVWFTGGRHQPPSGDHARVVFIPPGCRRSLSKPTDIPRFAMRGFVDESAAAWLDQKGPEHGKTEESGP